MNDMLSFLTTNEVRRIRILFSQRLEFIEKQLELINTKYPSSSGSQLIVNAYLKEKSELLSIKNKLLGGHCVG